MAAGYRSQAVRKWFTAWAIRNNLTIQTHIRRYCLYIEFERERDLTLACLQWPYSGGSVWDRFEIVDVLPERAL